MNHVSGNCPVHGKCRHCLEPDNMARECTNPPTAWETMNQGANTPSVVADPTPAEATQASCDGGSSAVLAFSSSVSTRI